MATGEVKWFNNAKGWGFIMPEGAVKIFLFTSQPFTVPAIKPSFPGNKSVTMWKKAIAAYMLPM